MELADEQDVTVVGVTAANRQVVEAYREDLDLDLPILANAGPMQEAWGVRLIWGNVVKLVNPDGVVVSEGLGAAAKVLRAREQ